MDDGNKLQFKYLSYEDLDQVAIIHQQAFPESYLSHINQTAIVKYYQWHMRPPNLCYPLGAFHNNQLLGFCFSGTFRNADYYFILENWLFFMKFFISHPSFFFRREIFQRIKKLGGYLKEYTLKKINNKREKHSNLPDRFGILSIAVDPKRQHSGVGKALMKEIEQVAIEKNYIKITLSVHPDNHQAVAFYEKNGWSKVGFEQGHQWQGLMEKNLVK
jgi:ribosomal protein S18 acetylase RimI-like enzyme